MSIDVTASNPPSLKFDETNLAKRNWDQCELLLGVLTCFFLPFKITFSYIFLIPFIYLEIFIHRAEIVKVVKTNQTLRALLLFCLVAALTSFFGINLLRSLKHLGTLFFFPLTIFCFYRLTSRHSAAPFMQASLYGLSVACIIQLIELILPSFNSRFLGPVSQSGQIAVMIIPLTYYYLKDAKDIFPKNLFNLLCLTFIIIAFICNLKRGPWLGVLMSSLIFCLFYYRRLLIGLFVITISLFLLEPIRERILLSEAHFFIPGGRYAIWEIGKDLLLTYPLGIGFENSGFLRAFSSEIPYQLKHFHSNFLNIAVETGWLGIGLYITWLFSIARFCVISYGPNTKIVHAIGFGLLAWQIAGFVEYNFGDSAVVTFAYILIGILLGINDQSQRAASSLT